MSRLPLHLRRDFLESGTRGLEEWGLSATRLDPRARGRVGRIVTVLLQERMVARAGVRILGTDAVLRTKVACVSIKWQHTICIHTRKTRSGYCEGDFNSALNE